jgi:hypothetical protein
MRTNVHDSLADALYELGHQQAADLIQSDVRTPESVELIVLSLRLHADLPSRRTLLIECVGVWGQGATANRDDDIEEALAVWIDSDGCLACSLRALRQAEGPCADCSEVA